jgi:hypothetical protein
LGWAGRFWKSMSQGSLVDVETSSHRPPFVPPSGLLSLNIFTPSG